MKYGLTEIQFQEIIAFIEKYVEVEQAVLFGSRAMDTFKEASDMDIALKGEKVTVALAQRIKFDIEEDSYLPFFFDIVAYSAITNEALKQQIDKKGVVIFKRVSEWQECKLGDVAEVQTGPFGSQLHSSDYVPIGIPSIMPTNIGARLEIIRDNIAYITESDAKRLSKYLVENGDIVYSRRGDVEKCAFITKNESGWLCGTGCLRVRFISDKVLPKFCAYYLSTDEMKGWISGHAVGTTMPNLNSSILRRLPLTIPPLPEQKAIAAVLSSLDDKIDLLHRQNKTLEQIAETLFKQWFIVEARDDWEEKPLGDIIETTSGGTPPRSKMEYYENGSIHWVKSKELYGSFILETEEMITNDAIKNSSAKLLPKNSILIAMYGATVGEYAIISKEMTCNQAICALKPNDKYPYTFILMFIKNIKEELINMAVGSAQQNISQLLIKQLSIPTCYERIKEFDNKVLPLFEKMKTNINQIRTLEKLRDELLPKLMSGEVRVKCA